MSNIGTVQNIYAAFGRGDVPTILSHLAEDVSWEDDASGELPLLVPRSGRAGVGEFFAAIGATGFTRFEPTAFLESGNVVVALVDVAFTVKATGKQVEQLDEAHIWRFNDSGLVQNFRHRVDTLAHQRAFSV